MSISNLPPFYRKGVLLSVHSNGGFKSSLDRKRRLKLKRWIRRFDIRIKQEGYCGLDRLSCVRCLLYSLLGELDPRKSIFQWSYSPHSLTNHAMRFLPLPASLGALSFDTDGSVAYAWEEVRLALTLGPVKRVILLQYPICLLVQAESQLSHERRVSSSVFMVTPKIGFSAYTIEE